MSEIPEDLKYAESHEWVAEIDDGLFRVGISDHAQSKLGDLVYVELPGEGDNFSAGDACAVIESVKAASDVYCPISGEIVAVNDELTDSPELVNNDAYGDGWLFVVRPNDDSELDALMNAEAYLASIEE